MSISNWDVTKRAITPEPIRSGSPKAKTYANTKLTALTGLLIFILLALEGVTIPFIGPLLTIHVFIGWVLLPPILLKIASTTYRFAMYYTGSARYVKAGPPKPLLRVLAPLVIIFTTLLMWSGIEIVLIGPSGANIGLWRTIHKASFIVWFGIMAIHVLAYFLKAGSFALPELTRAPGSHSVQVPGRNIRLALVVGSLVLGIIIGLMQWHLATSWIAQLGNSGHFG